MGTKGTIGPRVALNTHAVSVDSMPGTGQSTGSCFLLSEGSLPSGGDNSKQVNKEVISDSDK